MTPALMTAQPIETRSVAKKCFRMVRNLRTKDTMDWLNNNQSHISGVLLDHIHLSEAAQGIIHVEQR